MKVLLRTMLGLMLAAASALVATEPSATACSIASPRPLVLDPQSTDTTPPGVPTATVTSIRRGKGPEGCSSSSCDDLGRIDIALTAEDDQVAADKLGFQVEVSDGNPPSGLRVPSGPVLASGGHLYLHWVDGNSDEQESISFTVSIRAVDLAGNTSPPATVNVSDGGSGGCRLGGRRLGSSWATTVVLLVVAVSCLRRRR